ncbi:M48 family metallopeptidase [Candidatus Saccharibacteria bacterium]|nr:M48 family metallopeptidase [Candidatus Saccharibacteria bacterium]
MYTEIARNKRNSYVLIFFFLLLIIGFCWVFSLAFNNQLILYLGVGFSLIYAGISYFTSSSMVLAISRARPIEKKDNLVLYRTVENLAITAGLPTPKIYIIQDTAPNAFATGRDPQHAVVCVTSGLLEMMTKPELEGVLAHELSHVGNYDIRFMTLVVVMVGVIVLLSDWFIRISFFSDDSDSGGGNLQTIMMVVGLVLAILAPFIGLLMQLAFGRKREYLADSSAVLLTRYPEGLASALEKIDSDTKPLREANRATANLYIISPLRANIKGGSKSRFASLFSTHPPTAERIKRLRKMETHA